MSNEVHFAWISLTRQKEVKLATGLWRKSKRAHISFPTSGNESTFHRHGTQRQWKADAFFAFTSASDLKQPLPSTSSLLAVHSTCPQTVSALAHNVSGYDWVRVLDQYISTVRLLHYRFLWLTSSTFVFIVLMDISHIKSLITWRVPSSSDTGSTKWKDCVLSPCDQKTICC